MIKTIEKDNLNIKMIVDTDLEEHRFNTFFDKEPETVDWIKTFLKPGDVFFDVGANVGVFSLLAAAIFKDKVATYAFEPVYHNFDKLCKNIIVNNFKNYIKPFPVAIGEETKFSYINLASEVPGSASHLMVGAPQYFFNNFVTEFQQGVFSVSLDDMVDKFKFEFPNHIKIDTDGFEENIAQGAKKVFSDSRLQSVLIEITNEDGAKDRIIGTMKECGLKNDHLINFQSNHSRVRREQKGGNIENLIFTR